MWRNGRRSGLKIRSSKGRAGSSPAIGISAEFKARTQLPHGASAFARLALQTSLASSFDLSFMHIILASASPRRSQLLRDLGVPFSVSPSNVHEPPPTEEDAALPGTYVEKLAHLKAQSDENEAIVIAADTVVVLENEILGKPADIEAARAMLQRLRGQTHEVFTGVCVREGRREILIHETTRVTFGQFSDDFIEAYIATGEPMDKAGAYAAQGRGALLIERIEGDYFNVVGLPLFALARVLAQFDVEVAEFWSA